MGEAQQHKRGATSIGLHRLLIRSKVETPRPSCRGGSLLQILNQASKHFRHTSQIFLQKNGGCLWHSMIHIQCGQSPPLAIDENPTTLVLGNVACMSAQQNNVLGHLVANILLPLLLLPLLPLMPLLLLPLLPLLVRELRLLLPLLPLLLLRPPLLLPPPPLPPPLPLWLLLPRCCCCCCCLWCSDDVSLRLVVVVVTTMTTGIPVWVAPCVQTGQALQEVCELGDIIQKLDRAQQSKG